jgi:alpha-galactosidase
LAGAEKVASAGQGLEVWAKVLGARTSGEYAVMLLNLTEHGRAMEARWSDLDLLPNPQVRDLWMHRDVLAAPDGYQVTVPAHSAVLLRVSGARSWQHGGL